MSFAVDRISVLPEPLIEHILEGLPITDRARTSLLSTKWRFMWTQLQSLVLDRQFHHSVCKVKYKPFSDYMYIINSIGLQRTRHAREVSLFVPADVQTYSVRVFDHLIKSFLRNGVERLSVEKDGRSPYSVPSSIFTTVISSHLTHLQLHNCEFKPPKSFQGFPSLLSFEVRSFQATADVIYRFISSCPTLQKLVLENLNFPQQSLDIDAPQLLHLSVQGKFKWLNLINTETIEVLSINMDVLPEPLDGMLSVISNFFCGMTKLEKITLGGRFMELLALHNGSLTLASYVGLKSLSFVGLRGVKELGFVLNSIWSFPNLTELTISMDENVENNYVPVSGEVKIQDKIYDLEHLVRVDFQHTMGSKVEMKLFERLLGCSPALKLMAIKFSTRLRQDQILKCFRELILFRRSSILAKVDISETAPRNSNGYY